MSREIVTTSGTLRPIEELDTARLERFWAGKSGETRTAYAADLHKFARWCGASDGAAGLRALIGLGRGGAHEKIHSYVGELVEEGRSPAQVNRRLTAIRTAIDLCRQFGLCDWRLEIKNVKTEGYRDTRGPGLDNVGKLVQAAQTRSETPEKAARDTAIIRLLFDIALRRKEVAELDLEHVDLTARRVSILGKGRREREFLTLPAPTCAALTAWIALRGTEPGPLFFSFDRARKGDGRLTGDGIFRVVREIGKRIGIKVRPHGLRHSAITRALDVTKGDVRAAQRFSRHRNVKTLLIYDDNRADIGGELAGAVAASIGDGDL